MKHLLEFQLIVIEPGISETDVSLFKNSIYM